MSKVKDTNVGNFPPIHGSASYLLEQIKSSLQFDSFRRMYFTLKHVHNNHT